MYVFKLKLTFDKKVFTVISNLGLIFVFQCRILKELKSGLIGQREASRRYGIPRTTIIQWQRKDNLVTLLNAQSSQKPSVMTESQESKLLLRKIEELTKAP
jgi:transposase